MFAWRRYGHFRSPLKHDLLDLLELAFEKVRSDIWGNYIYRTFYSPTKPKRNGLLLNEDFQKQL